MVQAQRRTVSMGFTERRFPEGSHIIYVYSSDEERKATTAKFLQRGLEDNEKVLYLVHDIPPEEMAEEFTNRGVDVDKEGGGFALTANHPSCCPGDHFSRDYMLGLVGEFYASAMAEGFAGARGAGEMAWAAEDGQVDIRELLAYESDLNVILSEYPLTTVCQYDARLFAGDVIMDLLAVHPYMIVRGQLVENPHFLPTSAFLERLAQRYDD